MAVTEPPVDRSRTAGSRLLYRVDRWASRPATALVAIAGVMAWVLLSLAAVQAGGRRYSRPWLRPLR